MTTSAASNARAVGGGISPHQTAGAQQHAAKVSGDDHDEVSQSAVLQYFQRRGSRRLGRFTVIGVALPVALPQAVGVHIVPGRAVGCPHLLQKSHRLFLAVRKGELRNKAALFSSYSPVAVPRMVR